MKEIKIPKNADKQLGVRLPGNLYDKCVELSKKHETSVQDIIRYILEQEVENYQ